MSKRKSTKTDFSTILSSIFILLLVGVVVGFLFVRTDNFTAPLKTFYVTCGNDDIMQDRKNFDIIIGKEYKFKVNTNMDFGTEKKYIVSVVPNETSSTAFTFYVDGESVLFADVKSIGKGFSLIAREDYFIFTAYKDLPEILSLYYGNKTLTEVPTTIDSDIPYYRLVVQSADLSETININFNLKSE